MSKHLLISWLQSPSIVILEPKKIKSVTVSIFSLSICHEVMGLDAILVFFFFEMCTSLLQLWETYLPKSWIYLLTWSIDFSVTNSVSTAPHHKCPPQTLTTYLGGTQPPGSSSQPPLALAIHVSLPSCMNSLLTFAGVQSLHLATTVCLCTFLGLWPSTSDASCVNRLLTQACNPTLSTSWTPVRFWHPTSVHTPIWGTSKSFMVSHMELEAK